jgi:hypothetical protein
VVPLFYVLVLFLSSQSSGESGDRRPVVSEALMVGKGAQPASCRGWEVGRHSAASGHGSADPVSAGLSFGFGHEVSAGGTSQHALIASDRTALCREPKGCARPPSHRAASRCDRPDGPDRGCG